MQRRILEVHPEAVSEARAAKAWYERRSLAAAKAFVEELEAAVQVIAVAHARRRPGYWRLRSLG
jgi:plasmid stabilization system protein ParE